MSRSVLDVNYFIYYSGQFEVNGIKFNVSDPDPKLSNQTDKSAITFRSAPSHIPSKSLQMDLKSKSLGRPQFGTWRRVLLLLGSQKAGS